MTSKKFSQDRYMVTVETWEGTHEFVDCFAASEFDAGQQVGWAYVREGMVVGVSLYNGVTVTEDKPMELSV